MKLYNSIGPNPHAVRMFMAEKGIEISKEDIDIVSGKNREPDYLAKNPHGTCPALELDDGTCISEITAICEYLEELHPENPLLGTTAEERAEARMWARRVDLYICEPMGNGFRFGKGVKMFESRIHTIPEAAEGLQASASDRLAWLDGQMEGRDWVCGDRFTLADILLYANIECFVPLGQPLDPELKNIAAWRARVGERPSAKA